MEILSIRASVSAHAIRVRCARRDGSVGDRELTLKLTGINVHGDMDL